MYGLGLKQRGNKIDLIELILSTFLSKVGYRFLNSPNPYLKWHIRMDFNFTSSFHERIIEFQKMEVWLIV